MRDIQFAWEAGRHPCRPALPQLASPTGDSFPVRNTTPDRSPGPPVANESQLTRCGRLDRPRMYTFDRLARTVELHRQPLLRTVRPEFTRWSREESRLVDVRSGVRLHHDHWLARQNSVALYGPCRSRDRDLEFNRTMRTRIHVVDRTGDVGTTNFDNARLPTTKITTCACTTYGRGACTTSFSTRRDATASRWTRGGSGPLAKHARTSPRSADQI